MKAFINPDRNLLRNPLLIRVDALDQATDVIARSSNPIESCHALGYINTESFFPNLAKVLDVPFVQQLPVPISALNSIALRIPDSLLIMHQVYPYEEHGTLYIATANPFIPQTIWEEIVAYAGKPHVQLVISSPQEVSQAISYLCHVDLSITTSEKLTVLYPDRSSKTYTKTFVPGVFPFSFFALLIVVWILYPFETLTIVYSCLNVFYFLVNPFKFLAMFKSVRSRNILRVSDHDLTTIDEHVLPVYTILVPLRSEASLVPSLVQGLYELDYPTEKLDIKFICEIEDRVTIAALERLGIGVASDHLNTYSFTAQLVKVPKSGISSKPKACDYALGLARGQFTVIFDAEDKPDRDQLKKVFVGFLRSSLDTMCVQAKLNFYNSRQNILTRFFSMEYGFWYDFFLPGLQEIGSPLPLGGTSNHFVTQYLRKTGTWDPHNVTEDADLGFRIFRYKLKTSMIDSYTQEEANSRVFNWIRQRTRWQKGFLLTTLVHISNPSKLVKELGIMNTIFAIITFGGNFFMPLFNPLLWILFLSAYTPYGIHLPSVHPVIYYMGLFNLIIGNLTFIGIHLFAAVRLKRYDLAVLSLLLPLYWLLISVATFRAAIQFVTNPYVWEKTTHGLTKRASRKI